MRKHYIAVFVAIVMCLAALSGCSFLRALEKDVNVVFEVNGEYIDGVTVNIFNNAIAPEFDATEDGAVPDGYKFMGWSASHNWKYGDDKDLLISSGGIVRYNAVKDWVNEGGTAVAVPIIIDKATIPRADIVIAWYSADVSDIKENDIKAFEAELRLFLTERGYDVSGMDIVIRGYGGGVGTSCANIRKDDDVDIMLGWGGNITSTGGMVKDKDFIEHINNITIGSSSRYATRLTDTDLCNEIFIWIQNEYGPEPVVTHKVTFNSNGGSDVAVKYVESGKTVEKPANPTRDGYTFGGWFTDDVTFENEYDFSIPVTGDLELYAKWTEGDPDPEPEPVKPTPEDPTVQYDLVIAWYSKSDTSKITEEDAGKLEQAILTYLAGQEGFADKKILLRAYGGGVEASCGNIMAAGDVDIMVGWAQTSNLTGTGKMPADSILANVGNITIGSTARYAARLSDTDLCKLVYAWIQQEYGPKA